VFSVAESQAISRSRDKLRSLQLLSREKIGLPVTGFARSTRDVVNMIDVGEETGELDKMLIKIADNYDSDVDGLVEGMMSMIEPLLIVGLGGSIGFIVVALFLPLITLIQTMGQQ
jgi:type IV pilus assembly protein PilC